MSNQKTTLKLRGLYSDPNLLSSVPEGALVVADNIVINRDNIIESRRGNAKFGNSFGTGSDRSKQLLTYKNRVLIHYNDKILFNSMVHTVLNDGNFLPFAGSYTETSPGLRIKYAESNKNLFFTTNDGIKKISAKTASDFTTAANYIVDAGVFKALDLNGKLNFQDQGFLSPQSKIAYRVVWGYKDANDNLLLGSPSSRLVITNFSTTTTANVDLGFTVPQGITSAYFYQVYRTAIYTASGGLTLDVIDPGDEMNLVYEDFPTPTQLAGGSVTLTDISPDDFRQNGLPLYTNPESGSGIGQANEPPPIAKDLAMYQNTLFYANTISRANKSITLLGVEDLISEVSEFSVLSESVSNTYTFVGEKENTKYDFTSYTGTIPAVLNGTYWLMNSASDSRGYYVWFDTTETTQKFDFTNYIGTIPGDLNGTYVVFYAASDRIYYAWFDSTGTTPDPGLNPLNVNLAGAFGVKVDLVTGVTTKTEVATRLTSALVTANIFNDYDVYFTPGNNFVDVRTQSFDTTNSTVLETVQKGFSFNFSTPSNLDPANTPLVNTDVAGRQGFRVNVSRGVSTVADIADVVAASILDQDSALDFTVSYTTSDAFLTIENNNNGLTTNASDSVITPVGNGFAITILNEGKGADAALNYVLLSAAATPAQQIDETARSLVNIINKNPLEIVDAYYISGPNDLPGKILIQARDIGTNTFQLSTDSSETGLSFNPPLPPAPGVSFVLGEAEIKPNRLMYAKLQQPEAVPLLNYIDLGPEDQEISRILPLRESLIILKTDGVYRLNGAAGVWQTYLLDNTLKIIAPDSAVVLNNQIYCLSNQGVAVITDNGVSIISKELDNLFQIITSAQYNYKNTSFGIAYETDRSYILSLPEDEVDTVATQALRYNTSTRTWTKFLISKTCGLINPADNRLYLGPTDANFIERERKLFDRTDYADREFELAIPVKSVNGNKLTLSQIDIARQGDALVQTQYLTTNQINQLLQQLDLDPGVGTKQQFTIDFSSYVGTVPTSLHGKYFFMFSAIDAVKYVCFFDAVGTLTTLDPSVYLDVDDAVQIRINVSTGVTTKAQVVSKIQNTIKTVISTFKVTYTPGAEVCTLTCIKSGDATDAYESTLNPIGNGVSLVTTVQGFGSYYSGLLALPGINLKNKLENLAIKLDLDPGIANHGYTECVTDYSGTGAVTSPALATIVTYVNHGLETGRLVTILNSLVLPDMDGTYTVTRIDADNFSVPFETVVAGTCDFISEINTQIEIQSAFNAMIIKLNTDELIRFSNYQSSVGTRAVEDIVLAYDQTSAIITTQFAEPWIEGAITVYKAINCDVLFAPETFGDTSIMKQVREGTFIFQDCTFSGGTVGYTTDVSSDISLIPFSKSGKGDWGQFIFSQQNWGGGFSGVPLRVYVPLNKQKCRYIQAFFNSFIAREKWAMFGISYTFRPISERAYKG